MRIGAEIAGVLCGSNGADDLGERRPRAALAGGGIDCRRAREADGPPRRGDGGDPELRRQEGLRGRGRQWHPRLGRRRNRARVQRTQSADHGAGRRRRCGAKRGQHRRSNPLEPRRCEGDREARGDEKSPRDFRTADPGEERNDRLRRWRSARLADRRREGQRGRVVRAAEAGARAGVHGRWQAHPQYRGRRIGAEHESGEPQRRDELPARGHRPDPRRVQLGSVETCSPRHLQQRPESTDSTERGRREAGLDAAAAGSC